MKKHFYLSIFLIFQTHLLLSQTVGLVKDIAKGTNGSNVVNSIVSNNKFFFTAAGTTSPYTFIKDLWVSDGQEGGTHKLPIESGVGTPDAPKIFFNAQGTVYFVDKSLGGELMED